MKGQLLAKADDGGGVGVRVSSQQRSLVEHQTGVPDSWHSPQNGQDHLADHGLGREEQEGRQEHREAEQPGQDVPPRRGSWQHETGELSLRQGKGLVDLDRFPTISDDAVTRAAPGAAGDPLQRFRERTLPCHFTDGSAAASGSGNISRTTAAGSKGRKPAAARAWNPPPERLLRPTATAQRVMSPRASTDRCRSSIASCTRS